MARLFFFPLNLMSISWKIFQVLSLKAIGWHSVVKYFLSGSQEWINEWTHACLGIPPSTPIEKLYPEEASKARGSTVTKGDLGMLHRYGHWRPGAMGWVQGRPAGRQQAQNVPTTHFLQRQNCCLEFVWNHSETQIITGNERQTGTCQMVINMCKGVNRFKTCPSAAGTLTGPFFT